MTAMKKVQVILTGDEAALDRLMEVTKEVRNAQKTLFATSVHHSDYAPHHVSFVSTNYDAELRRRLALDAATKPPKAAEAALFFIAPKHQRDAFLGDLEEAFQECVRKFGRRTANLYYWWNVVRSVTDCFGPMVIRIIKELFG